MIEVDFGAKPAAAPKTDIVEAEIIEHINLNSSRSDKETIHLALAFDGAAPAYEPGDSLDLYAENDPAYVDELLKAAGLSADDDAARRVDQIARRHHAVAQDRRDLCGADRPSIRQGADRRQATAKDWIAGRQLIDLIAMFPIALTAEQLRALTRPLAPRAYSIASSRREVGEEAHLLISAVRYETHGRARKGVASNYVAERLKRGDRVRVKLKPNKHFALPAPDTRHHHGRTGHRRRAVPRLRAGAPRHRRPRAATGCSSATASSPTISSTSSNGRTRSRTAR